MTPPMPEASATARRSGSRPESSRPASAQACVGGDHGELARAVETAGLDPLEDLGRLDGDAAADLDGELVDPVVGEVPDAGRAGQHGLPGAATSPPTGEVVPSPVTTTRVEVIRSSVLAEGGAG